MWHEFKFLLAPLDPGAPQHSTVILAQPGPGCFPASTVISYRDPRPLPWAKVEDERSSLTHTHTLFCFSVGWTESPEVCGKEAAFFIALYTYLYKSPPSTGHTEIWLQYSLLWLQYSLLLESATCAECRLQCLCTVAYRHTTTSKGHGQPRRPCSCPLDSVQPKAAAPCCYRAKDMAGRPFRPCPRPPRPPGPLRTTSARRREVGEPCSRSGHLNLARASCGGAAVYPTVLYYKIFLLFLRCYFIRKLVRPLFPLYSQSHGYMMISSSVLDFSSKV
jgi:hypothetical protein